MKLLKLDKQTILKFTALIVLSSVMVLINLHKLGMKDSAMLFAATLSIIASIYLIFKDKKKSLLLFIVSLPVMVTARKAVYFDFLIFKVTYETVYISILFIFSFKDIVELIKRTYADKNRTKLVYFIYVFIFAIFALNSSIYSTNLMRSIGYTFISVIIPVVFMLSALVNFDRSDIDKILYALIIQISFSSLYGFYQIYSGDRTLRDRSMLTFGYNNVNIYAGLVILIIPFMLEMFFYGKRRIYERLLIASALLLNIGALAATLTRGAILAFLVSVPIIFISKRYKWILYAMGVLGAVAAKPAFSYIVHRGTSTGLESNESTIARVQSFFTSYKIVESYPFGIGSGNFAEFYKLFSVKGYLAMPEEFRTRILVASYNLEAAHNLWLQIAVELGIVCAVVFLAIILNRLWASLRNFKSNRAPIGAILAYLVFSVLTGVEFEHKGVITTTLVIWLIFGLIEINNRECSYGEIPD